MNEIIQTRLKNLRSVMKRRKLDAVIIPSNDSHFSEYISDYWKCREYISGFKGSAGSVVVTKDKACLWTDSRYFLQAGMELEGTGITLMKEGVDTTPDIPSWLSVELGKGKVGINGLLFSVTQIALLRDKMPELEIVPVDDFFSEIWKERPPMPDAPAFLLGREYAGEDVQEKVAHVRKILKLKKKRVYILSALDEVAWLLNIRGNDVNYNPVVTAYAVVTPGTVRLFVDETKFKADDIYALKQKGVELVPYVDFEKYLHLLSGYEVVYNPQKMSYAHYLILQRFGAVLEKEPLAAGIVAEMKAIKNDVEIAGFRRAVIEDGVALVRFYIWLEEMVYGGKGVTEAEAADKLSAFRAQSPLYRGESFHPIVGYKSNGAIVHYTPSKESSRKIKEDGFLLIDSGGQYLCGTTDITRTIYLGTPGEQEKTDFTLVLMGNIDLATAVFPENTRGSQLDILARRHLYMKGLTYLHGTGHGIGHYLNVHEGPQSVRLNENPETLKPGMVLSDEPGLYRPRRYGIRTENMLLCREEKVTSFGRFYGFETLTLFPIDTKCIDLSVLPLNHRRWLNRYHALVYDHLSPYLSTKEKVWLMSKTKEI